MPLGSETDQKRVREALLGLFPNHGLGKSLLEDCVSFALFLNLPKSDRTHFLSQVALLETALAGRLLDRPDVDVDLLDSDTLKRALRKHGSDARIRLREKRKEKLQEQDGQSSKKGSVFSHLLSEELAENEREWGFQLGDVNGHPKAHLIGPLNGNQFRAQLVNKRPFKDPTIVSDHGEFTHRIQWYLAATAEFFENPVADVYQAVGTVLWQQDPRYGLWDFLCDRNENETYIPWLMPSKPGDADYVLGGEFDFRCAAYLNRWLCKQGEDFPILATFLEQRALKRAALKQAVQNSNVPVSYEYLALKLYQQPYLKLGNDEKEKIRRAASQAEEGHGTEQEVESLRQGIGIFPPKSQGGYKSGY